MPWPTSARAPPLPVDRPGRSPVSPCSSQYCKQAARGKAAPWLLASSLSLAFKYYLCRSRPMGLALRKSLLYDSRYMYDSHYLYDSSYSCRGFRFQFPSRALALRLSYRSVRDGFCFPSFPPFCCLASRGRYFCLALSLSLYIFNPSTTSYIRSSFLAAIQIRPYRSRAG